MERERLYGATHEPLIQAGQPESLVDLPKLGELLKARRVEIGITKPALARRIGIGPSYVWLIENAVPRKSGRATRPSRRVLSLWTAVLEWDQEHQEQLLAMAGYEAITPHTEKALDLAELEERVLQNRIHKLVTSPELSSHQNEILNELNGFVQWIEFKYSNKENKGET